MFRKLILGNDPPEQVKYRGSINNREIQINLYDLARFLYRRKFLIVGVTGIVMVITAIIMIATPNVFKSTASILPSGKSDNLSGLKNLVGISNFAFSDNENSSLLFPTILRSNQVKDALLSKEYSFTHNSKNMKLRLQEYFGTDIQDHLYANLDGITNIDLNKKTGVIKISVKTRYPGLSQALLNNILAELENFNMYKRHSSAKESVRYLERELANMEKELKMAEDSLEAFQMANRNWYNTTNPGLLKILSRLKQDVEVKLKTYIFLRSQYETVRLDVQKDIPVVRILDTPSLPVLKSEPMRTKTVLLAGIIACFLVIFMLAIFDTAQKHGIYFESDNIMSSTGHATERIEENIKV